VRSNAWLSLPDMDKSDIVAPDRVSTISLGFRSFTGTSALMPHVAGVAAMLLSLNPALSTNTSNGEFKKRIVDYIKQIISSPDNIYGRGELFLNSDIISYDTAGDFVCYPNPTSVSKKGYIKITNLPFYTSMIDIAVYMVPGGGGICKIF
jgi:hypothetical protein